MLVDQNPLPPLLVIGRLSRKQGNEVILGVVGIVDGRRCRGRCRRRHCYHNQASAKDLDDGAKASDVELGRNARASAVGLHKVAQRATAVELVQEIEQVT